MPRHLDLPDSPLVLFVFISVYFFLLGMVAISADVSRNISFIVTGYFLFILTVQTVLLGLLFRIVNNTLISYSLLGLMLSGNSIAFYISFFERFLSLNTFTITLLGITFGILLSAFIFLSFRYKKNLLILALIITGSLLTGAQILAQKKMDPEDFSVNLETRFEKFKNISLKDTPNIHLVSFDSLMANALASKFLGLDNLAYDEYLRTNSIVFKNVFVSNAPSLASLNSIMRLADGDFHGRGFFAGRAQSPLSYIFSNNGYKIATGFWDDELFGPKGKFIHQFTTRESSAFVSDSTLCKYSNQKEKHFQLYGFCSFAGLLLEKKTKNPQFYQEAYKIIGENSRSGVPWLTFHYMYEPIGHTPKSFNSNDAKARSAYGEHYKRKSDELAGILAELVNQIRQIDPDSIVFIFGDHGPWLSRTVDFNENPEFYVQDRFGVFGALLKTNHFCSSSFINQYGSGYTTVERIMAGILRCLAENPEAVDRVMNFEESHPFEEYLYE